MVAARRLQAFVRGLREANLIEVRSDLPTTVGRQDSGRLFAPLTGP